MKSSGPSSNPEADLLSLPTRIPLPELSGSELAAFRDAVNAMTTDELEEVLATRLTKEQVNIVLRAQRLPIGGRFDDLRFDDGSPYAKTNGQ